MNPASPSQPGGRAPHAAPLQSERVQPETPNADMQADDTGTTDSGAAGQDDSGTAATRAMKQTSKTAAESGDSR